jgi:hypothetical protein
VLLTKNELWQQALDMKLKFSDEGLVVGGVDCSTSRAKSHKETVTDLTDWIKRQLLELQKEGAAKSQVADKHLAFHHVWIGNGVMPFGFIQATKSKYTAFCVHPEFRDRGDLSLTSSNVDKVSAFLAEKASRASNLDWQPSSNTN